MIPCQEGLRNRCTLPAGHDQESSYLASLNQIPRDTTRSICPIDRTRTSNPSSATRLPDSAYDHADTVLGILTSISKLNALRESGGELTIVVFTADEEPAGELKKLHEDKAVTDQVRIYAERVLSWILYDSEVRCRSTLVEVREYYPSAWR